jgi:hypothetical protein
MKKYTFILISFIALLISGCATPKQSIVPNLRIIDLPTIGQIQTSELGETLVQKGKIYTYEAIRLENSVTAGDGFFLKKLTLQPGVLKASMRDTDRTYYTTEKLEVYDALLGNQMHSGGLAISQKNEKDINFHLNGSAIFTPSPDPILTKIQVSDLDRPSFRQELIYNGRSGNTIKFLYREYSSDALRTPFSQEVQYDLHDAPIIGFKGVRMEVIEATNTKFKYRVLSSFPDSI